MKLSEIPAFPVSVRGKNVDIKMAEELGVDFEDLNKTLCQHSALLAYWGAVLAYMTEELNKAQDKFKRTQAQRAIDIRVGVLTDPTQFGLPKEVKVTEAVIDSLLTSDGDLAVAQEAIFELKREVGVVAALCDGYAANTGILITLGKRHVQEVEAVLRDSVRKTHARVEQEKNRTK